jgi:hypothetical protein
VNAVGLQLFARELVARAEKELYDEAKIHHDMTQAYADLEVGKITEQEFDRREEDLLERLEIIAARRRGDVYVDEKGEVDDLEDEDEDEDEDDEIHYGVFDDSGQDDDDLGAQVQAHATLWGR